MNYSIDRDCCPSCKSGDTYNEDVQEFDGYYVVDCGCNKCETKFTMWYSFAFVSWNDENDTYTLNNNMARTIGKWNIKTLRGLIQFELKKNPNVSPETIVENLPDEWFDIWEGAYTEITNLVYEEIMLNGGLKK